MTSFFFDYILYRQFRFKFNATRRNIFINIALRQTQNLIQKLIRYHHHLWQNVSVQPKKTPFRRPKKEEKKDSIDPKQITIRPHPSWPIALSRELLRNRKKSWWVIAEDRELLHAKCDEKCENWAIGSGLFFANTLEASKIIAQELLQCCYRLMKRYFLLFSITLKLS